MSMDFYPAKLVEKVWEPIFPWTCGEATKLHPDADDPAHEGPTFIPNPEYIPFSHLNMSNGNASVILNLLGFDHSAGRVPCEYMVRKCHDFLFDSKSGRTRDVSEYVAEKTYWLRGMAQLGLSRGATHIVWV